RIRDLRPGDGAPARGGRSQGGTMTEIEAEKSPADPLASLPKLDPAELQPLAAVLMARDRWRRNDLLEVQRQRLDDLLGYAASASPYYRDLLGPAVASGRALEELPVLTKTTLMEQWDRIVTEPGLRLRDVEAHLASQRCGELLLGEFRAFATGGTTGE